ncbi:MAG: glycosyltransferase [Bacteroidales bacterium]|nr:glycosyltransferase [Bacteroidales bacterium]
MNPEVSIIMPVFNSEQYTADAIKSVLQQVFTNFEFIIINDASTDKTLQIINHYSSVDNRIKIITNPENLGIVKSLNIGLQSALGNYIARIDSDDLWHKNKLGKQISYFKNNANLFLLGTAKVLIDKFGNPRTSEEKQFFLYDDIKKQIGRGNLFCHSSVVFKREVINDIGYYNEKYKNSEDYEYWLRILSKKRGEILPEPLTYYRIHINMISIRKRKEQFKYVIKAKLNAIIKMGYPISGIFFIVKDLWPLLIPDFLIRIKKYLWNFLIPVKSDKDSQLEV